MYKTGVSFSNIYFSDFKHAPRLSNWRLGLQLSLVVLGHIIGGGHGDNSILNFTHYMIYSIHMPMFILITGILSKKETGFNKVIGNYIIPYIIFDFAYVVYGTILKQHVSWNILIPSYAYWYILCIAIMKLLYSKTRIEIMLIASVALSVIVTLFIPETVWRWLSIGRVLLLFPVFYIGTLLCSDRLRILTNHRTLLCSFGIMAIIILYLFPKLGIVPINWATHDYSAKTTQLVIKYFYMLLTVIVFLGLFCIIPESAILQRWGRNSIIIYLLHPFVVPIVRYGVNKVANSEVFALFLMLVSALIISMVLSLDFFKRAYDILIKSVQRILKLEV